MKNDKILQNCKNIHFIGIGGISLSALAKLMQAKGKNVTGSDINKTHIITELKSLGIKVFLKHSKKNIKNADLVVYTSAIKQNNIELKSALKKGIPCFTRAKFLALVASEYEKVIAISGSHGKTTTCGMLASVFNSASLKPTVHIGGESQNTNGNMLIGGNKFFITEACEYKNNFLTLKPDVSVILNIDYDHSDYFKNFKEVEKSFVNFANKTKNKVVINEKYKSVVNTKKQITFNYSNANYTAKNIKITKNFELEFDCFYKGKFLEKFLLKTPLVHNVYNALAVIAVSRVYKLSLKTIKKGLSDFLGIKRRFEYTGKFNSNIVIHDYAHHPKEIITSIKECKAVYKKNVIVVFQPHTFSRTKALKKEFIKAFIACDELILIKTYNAREKKIKGGSSKDLYNFLKGVRKNIYYFKKFSKVKSFINKKQYKDSVILVLGAGDIEKLAYEYLK